MRDGTKQTEMGMAGQEAKKMITLTGKVRRMEMEERM